MPAPVGCRFPRTRALPQRESRNGHIPPGTPLTATAQTDVPPQAERVTPGGKRHPATALPPIAKGSADGEWPGPCEPNRWQPTIVACEAIFLCRWFVHRIESVVPGHLGDHARVILARVSGFS
jgi:hypothetical protein